MSFVIVKKGDKKAKYNKNLQTLENELQGLDAYKYCGLIKLIEDPLSYQKKIRDEWQ